MDPNPHARPPEPNSPQAAARDADPDAVGLPPNIILPNAEIFRRDQLWGWVVSNAVGLALVLGLWLFVPNMPRLLEIYAAVLGVSLFINVIRWRWPRWKFGAGSDEPLSRSRRGAVHNTP